MNLILFNNYLKVLKVSKAKMAVEPIVKSSKASLYMIKSVSCSLSFQQLTLRTEMYNRLDYFDDYLIDYLFLIVIVIVID